MTVLPNKLFSRNPTTDTNIGCLAAESRSLYSTGSTRCARPLCSLPRRAAVISLATIASLPLSWRVTEMEKLGNINSMIKDIMGSDCDNQASETEEERLKKLVKTKEKTAKIHVYVQDVLGEPNPTVLEVARSVQTAYSTTSFGQVQVVDDLLTAGADIDSEKLGRTQGLITFSDLNELALIMNLTFNFTGGEYKGSSLCIGGRNPLTNTERELAIVGGTGVFRMARGYAISKTHSFDYVNNYGVFEYTFYVAYPDQEYNSILNW